MQTGSVDHPTDAQAFARHLIFGVGPDAEIVQNAAGGRQSKVNHRCDLLPSAAVLSVAEVLHKGCEKYGPNNWRKISTAEHVNHAMIHLFCWLAGDEQDDHLQHAACRVLMALEQQVNPPAGTAWEAAV
jgi:hypothetical protein